MEKNIIKIKVDFKNRLLESDTNIKLVQNDNNSTKLIFIIESDQTAYKSLTFKLPDGTGLIYELQDNNFIIPSAVLLKAGQLEFELTAYDNTGKKTNFAIGEAYIRESLVNSDQIVEPDDRVPILDNLIEETIEATSNANNVANDLVQKRDTGFFNGKSLEFNWDNTYLGIRQEGQEEYQYTNLKGEKGDVQFFNFDIIDGNLVMLKTDDFESHINFRLNEDGQLVEIMEVS